MATFYIGPTGQTLYVRIQTGAATFVATALTEGSTSLLNHYAVADATIAGLTGMSVAGDYPYQVRVGTPSTTAADNLVGYGTLYWTGSTERPASANVTQFGGTAGTFANGFPTTIPQALPRTIYVDPSGGNDSNAGLTRSSAKLTGASAITAANAGDTIRWIGLETLSGTLTVNKSLTLEADNWSCGVTGAIAGGSYLVNLTADCITLRNMRINETSAAVGVHCNGVNVLTIDSCYITGQGDGFFSNLLTVGYALDINRSRFTSTWDGAVLGRWQMARVKDSYFYTDGSFANGGSPLPSYHACTGGAGGSTLMNVVMEGNTFVTDVISSSNVNNSSTVSCLTIGERTLASGKGNTFVGTAAKTSWTGTIAGIDSNADDTNGTPTIAMDGYSIRITSTAGTPTKYDVWSRNLSTPASSAKGIVELGQGQTTDGTTTQFSETTGAYIRTVLQPTVPLRKLDIAATGEAGLDFDNIKDATGSHTLTNITVPTVTTLTNGVSVASGGITSGSFAANSITASSLASDAVAEIGSGVGASSDTRDLQPVQFTWKLSRRSESTLVSTNTLHIAAGESIRCGFDCDNTIVLPGAAVLGSMTDPTGTGDDLTVIKLGIDPKVAKVEVSADANAAAGATEYYVRTTVLNDDGAGPITLIGKIKIVADPTQ